ADACAGAGSGPTGRIGREVWRAAGAAGTGRGRGRRARCAASTGTGAASTDTAACAQVRPAHDRCATATAAWDRAGWHSRPKERLGVGWQQGGRGAGIGDGGWAGRWDGSLLLRLLTGRHEQGAAGDQRQAATEAWRNTAGRPKTGTNTAGREIA